MFSLSSKEDRRVILSYQTEREEYSQTMADKPAENDVFCCRNCFRNPCFSLFSDICIHGAGTPARAVVHAGLDAVAVDEIVHITAERDP